MKPFQVKSLIAAAVLGSLVSTTAFADEPGVVRISDGIKQTSGESVPAPLPEFVPVAQSNIQPIPEQGTIEGEVIYLDENGNQISGPGGTYIDQYGQTHTPKTYRTRIGMWTSGDRYAIELPADYGFVPPTAWPYVEYSRTTYQRFLQNPLYGTPGMR